MVASLAVGGEAEGVGGKGRGEAVAEEERMEEARGG